MKTKWGVCVFIVIIMLAATTIWTYLSTVTKLPNLGFGMEIGRWTLFALLIVVAVILAIIFVKGKPKEGARKSS